MLLKPNKDPKSPQNLCLISLLSTTGKLFKKAVLKIVRWHVEERGLLNASQFGFHARHSTTLERMRLMDHITLNLKNDMSMAVVFLDTEKPLIQHGTSACYTNYLNYNFQLCKSSILALSQRKFRSLGRR
jgi:hypothetical protein